LFIGLMIDQQDDPYVVEFNVRFGDPECQVTLPLIETDMYELMHGAATETLGDVELHLRKGSAVTVVLASEGYPASPQKGRLIRGLAEVVNGSTYGKAWVNFAGVSIDDTGEFIASGGRVLSCTAVGNDVKTTQQMAYELLGNINLEGGHFRTDIAHRAMR